MLRVVCQWCCQWLRAGFDTLEVAETTSGTGATALGVTWLARETESAFPTTNSFGEVWRREQWTPRGRRRAGARAPSARPVFPGRYDECWTAILPRGFVAIERELCHPFRENIVAFDVVRFIEFSRDKDVRIGWIDPKSAIRITLTVFLLRLPKVTISLCSGTRGVVTGIHHRDDFLWTRDFATLHEGIEGQVVSKLGEWGRDL